MPPAISTSTPRHAPMLVIVHWLTAISVLIVIPLGFLMFSVPEGELQNAMFSYHESFGLLIWFIALLRIAIRLANPAPAYDPPLTAFERRASAVVHGLLYLMTLFMPLIGYLAVSTYPAEAHFFFGDVPNLVPPDWRNKATHMLLGKAHTLGGYLMSAIVALHIAAAFMHAIIRRDGVFSRMTIRR